MLPHVDVTPSTGDIDNETCDNGCDDFQKLALPPLGWSEAALVAATVPIVTTASLITFLVTPLFFVAPLAALCIGCATPLIIRHCWRLRKQSALCIYTEKGLATASSQFTRSGRSTLHSISHSAGHGRPSLICHFSHGFAANCLTWEPFFPTLAHSLSGPEARVVLLAHDRPGFGLTSRPADVDGYSESVCADLAIDLVRQAVAASEDGRHGAPLSGPKLVLVGHSLGCAQAMRVALRAPPQAVRALVLLAPALMPCPRRLLPAAPPPLQSLLRACLGVVLGVVCVCSHLAAPLAAVVGRALCVLLRLTLFSCLHSARFWRLMLVHAYADESKLTLNMEWRYRWVTRVRGADAATVRYLGALGRQVLHNLWPELSASCADVSSRGGGTGTTPCTRTRAAATAAGTAGAAAPPTEDAHAARMMEDDDALWSALAEAGVPVLIVHGRHDRVIPAWNSRRLAAAMPSARLVELDGCGHNVHEECPEQLAACVAEFVSGVR